MARCQGTPVFTPAPLREAQRDLASPTEKKRGDGLERRSPTGIARERETSADGTPNCITPVEQKGGDRLERRSPTGIARERETSADGAPNCITPVEQKGGDRLERRSETGAPASRHPALRGPRREGSHPDGWGLCRRGPAGRCAGPYREDWPAFPLTPGRGRSGGGRRPARRGCGTGGTAT